MRSFFYRVIHAQAKTELQKWKVIYLEDFVGGFKTNIYNNILFIAFLNEKRT